jgi:hypothetical protein
MKFHEIFPHDHVEWVKRCSSKRDLGILRKASYRIPLETNQDCGVFFEKTTKMTP